MAVWRALALALAAMLDVKWLLGGRQGWARGQRGTCSCSPLRGCCTEPDGPGGLDEPAASSCGGSKAWGESRLGEERAGRGTHRCKCGSLPAVTRAEGPASHGCAPAYSWRVQPSR